MIKIYKSTYYVIQLAAKDLKRLGYEVYILKGKNYNILAVKNTHINLIKIVDRITYNHTRHHHTFSTFGQLSTSIWTMDKIHRKWRKRELGISLTEIDRTLR